MKVASRKYSTAPLLVLAMLSLIALRKTSYHNSIKYDSKTHIVKSKGRSKAAAGARRNIGQTLAAGYSANTKRIAPELSVYDNIHPVSNANDTAVLKSSARKTRKERKQYQYHDYAVFIVHYHKTGYVLSRELKNLVRRIEFEYNRPTTVKYKQEITFEVSGIDDSTGERIAFDHVGNWARSASPQRRHMNNSQCPKRFNLERGKMYVQESPDLFCSDEAILEAMNASKGGTKIIHFVRNSFDMAISNFFYHSQDPSPEKWVHGDDPCENLYLNDESLSSHIVPTLASWARGTGKGNRVTEKQMNDIVKMCKSIYQKKKSLKDATFYEHLMKLDQSDGLRLATAQMTVASGEANKHLAGGDILRMANNIVRFQALQETHKSNVHVLTVSMDEFIKDMETNTLKFLDFVFGDRNDSIPREIRLAEAKLEGEKYERKKNKSHHITQSNNSRKVAKGELKEMLKMDTHLGPVLNLTETLVNEALATAPSI